MHIRGYEFKRVLPKSGIPGDFSAKISYMLKTSTKHTPGALLLARLAVSLWHEKAKVYLFCSTLSTFQLILAKFEATRAAIRTLFFSLRVPLPSLGWNSSVLPYKLYLYDVRKCTYLHMH